MLVKIYDLESTPAGLVATVRPDCSPCNLRECFPDSDKPELGGAHLDASQAFVSALQDLVATGVHTGGGGAAAGYRLERVAICQIKWIDKSGNPTPDDNPAIQRVRCKARIEQIGGRGIRFSESEWFPICAEHSARLNDPGMHIWECEAL